MTSHLDNAHFLAQMAARLANAADGPTPELVTVMLSPAEVARMIALHTEEDDPEGRALPILLSLLAQCTAENN